MHKNVNFSVSVKGKISVFRPSLTVTSEFVEGSQGLEKKFEFMIQVFS